MDTSKDRRKILDCYEQMGQLVDTFVNRKPMLEGYVCVLKRKCGKPNCRCARGQLHPRLCLAYYQEGKMKIRQLSEAQHRQAERLAGRYRRMRTARAQWVKLSKDVLDRADRLQKALSRKADSQFKK